MFDVSGHQSRSWNPVWLVDLSTTILTESQALLHNSLEYRLNPEENGLDHDPAYIRHPTFVDGGVAGNPRIGDYGSLGHPPRHPISSSRVKDFRLSSRPGIQDVP